MDIDQILLDRGEVLIHDSFDPSHPTETPHPIFFVPIHPKLLSKNVSMNEFYAKSAFPEVVDDWQDDLKKYSDSIMENKNYPEEFDKEEYKSYIDTHISRKVEAVFEHNEYKLKPTSWESSVTTSETGFARSISVGASMGGTLFFDPNSEYMVSPHDLKFSDEKFLEYQSDKKFGNPKDGLYVNAYSHHNIDWYPSGLFLRNWAVKYLNKVMKQVL